MINIGQNRECFFDDFLVDPETTTAEARVHHPVRRETVLTHDEAWEGDGCDFHNFFYDDGLWRMYYLGWYMLEKFDGIRVCYAESTDGIHWVKPKLGICEYKGSKENNIILDQGMHGSTIDNFMVFRDDNPACLPEQRYKAIARFDKPNHEDGLALTSYFSGDGIHFTRGHDLTTKGAFDSLNVAFWDDHAGLYRCYFRGAHAPGEATPITWFDEDDIRDIRTMESKDFVHWSEPRLLDFGAGEDIPLYTNVAQNYARAPQYVIGFPSRYVYRREWNGSFEELCGREKRQERMKTSHRYGMTLTDCVFMASRDGHRFTRWDEAFMRPEPEHAENWIYGDCYPARGLMETPSAIPGADPELSLFVFENHWMGKPANLVRYSLRCDGFVSMHAGAKERKLVTQPFIYEGSEMKVNFETSALGYMYFALVDEAGNRVESCETFGNSIDRRVAFPEGAVAKLSGKPVTLEVRLWDADLYSFRFEKWCFGQGGAPCC